MSKVKSVKKVIDNSESMERVKSEMPLDRPKLIRTKKVIEEVIDEKSEEEDENDEEKEIENKKILLREKKLIALSKARSVRAENNSKREALKEKEKNIMKELMTKEIGEKYKDSRQFKIMQNKLEKSIIKELRDKKLKQLKEKYNYTSENEEESEYEEEEPKPILKKKVNKNLETFEVFNKYGF